MTAKKKATPTVVAPQFTITFTAGDQIYKGEGATILDALRAIPRPAKITTKGYVRVTDGTREKNLPLTVERAKRFFYPIAQTFVAKQLAYGLK